MALVGALVVLAAEAGSIEPGTTAENVVLVRNTGDQPDEFNVTIQGPASAWAAIEPTVLRLAPEEEGAACGHGCLRGGGWPTAILASVQSAHIALRHGCFAGIDPACPAALRERAQKK